MNIIEYARGAFAALSIASLSIVGEAAIGSTPANAAEEVDVAIISFSPYSAWYIVKERGLAKDIDLNIRIIEDITAKNAAIASGNVQCMLNTLDSLVVARAAGVPLKVVALPDMSYGLDEMVATPDVQSVSDLPGKTYGADFAFLNHMWMLLTLKNEGMPYDSVEHRIMLPQESAAAFVSGGIDVDVNYKPFSSQSLTREGAHVLKSSLTDRTWERGLISDAIACNENWLKEKPEVAKELLRAWFEAVDWWKQNPDAGNKIVAAGLDWPEEDVRLNQYGAIILNLEQNLGAFGVEGGNAVCKALPAGAPLPPAEPSGWGEKLFGGKPDCENGYLADTWNLFGQVYTEAGVLEGSIDASAGLDASILEALAADKVHETYQSNEWIGRVGL
ncbi:MAG: ABC transporter substrate-binding protein [Rhodospirillales bacterium]